MEIVEFPLRFDVAVLAILSPGLLGFAKLQEQRTEMKILDYHSMPLLRPPQSEHLTGLHIGQRVLLILDCLSLLRIVVASAACMLLSLLPVLFVCTIMKHVCSAFSAFVVIAFDDEAKD